MIPRRWMLLSNPKHLLITNKIGKSWIKNLDELKQMEVFAEDAEFRENWQKIKQENKHDLAQDRAIQEYSQDIWHVSAS